MNFVLGQRKNRTWKIVSCLKIFSPAKYLFWCEIKIYKLKFQIVNRYMLAYSSRSLAHANLQNCRLSYLVNFWEHNQLIFRSDDFCLYIIKIFSRLENKDFIWKGTRNNNSIYWKKLWNYYCRRSDVSSELLLCQCYR